MVDCRSLIYIWRHTLLWQSIWPNVPTSELLLEGVHGCLNQALVFVLCNCLLLEYVEQCDGVFIRGSIIVRSVKSTDVRNCRIIIFFRGCCVSYFAVLRFSALGRMPRRTS